MCPFDYKAIAVSKLVKNHTSLTEKVTPTDHRKSVRNRCVIEGLVAFLCGHLTFIIGLSQVSYSFS